MSNGIEGALWTEESFPQSGPMKTWAPEVPDWSKLTKSLHGSTQ